MDSFRLLGQRRGAAAWRWLVVERAVGAPIAGAGLFQVIYRRNSAEPDETLLGASGADGTFDVTTAMIVFRSTGSVIGRAPLNVRARGYASEFLHARIKGGESELRAELGKGSFMAGRVLDDAGAPVAGAMARASLSSPGNPGQSGKIGVSHQKVVGDDGSFRLEGIDVANQVSLKASAEDHVRSW